MRTPILASLAFIVLTCLMGFLIQRCQFGWLLGTYACWFALYLWVINQRNRVEGTSLLWLGMGLRVLLLFSIPNLSDDFYRFLWDGRLAAAGVHPFAHPPNWFMEQGPAIPGITRDLYQHLNSPEYYTVYPPVCQAVFWLAAKLFPDSLAGGVFVMKLFLLGCEAGTVLLLRNLSTVTKILPDGNSRLYPADVAYALNPLAIVEIVGNCHFEGAMLCFLLAGLWALTRGRLAWAAGFWALATASKLLPLMFLPIVLVALGWKKGWRFGWVYAAVCAVLFLPLLDIDVMSNVASSLNLYFRQFEFNASAYYILKGTGTLLAPPGYDVARKLGPILAFMVMLGILIISFYLPRKYGGTDGQPETNWLPKGLVWALTLYLALATTVHPWYIVPVFGLGLLTPYRFPLVWSFAAVFSYSHYTGGGFQEQFGWIGLEYALVCLSI